MTAWDIAFRIQNVKESEKFVIGTKGKQTEFLFSRISKVIAVLLGLSVFLFASCSTMIEDLTNLVKDDTSGEPQIIVPVVDEGEEGEQEEQKFASYTIRYYFEQVNVPDEEKWLEDTTMTIIDSALVGSEITGYEIPPVQFYKTPALVSGDTTVKEDGSSELKIFYEKASVVLTFVRGQENDDSVWTDGYENCEKTIEGKIGTNLTLQESAVIECTQQGKAFVGWEIEDEENNVLTVPNPTQFPEKNMTYTAKWVDLDRTVSYSVQYWFEKTNLGSGNHFAEILGANSSAIPTEANFTRNEEDEPESAVGEIGGNITISPANYSGFTAFSTGENFSFILDEDAANNVIKIYYYRNAVSLTFKSDSDSVIESAIQAGNEEYGKFTAGNGGGTSKVVSGFYGDTVTQFFTASDVEKQTATRIWEFVSWSSEIATIFPSANAIYTAQWQEIGNGDSGLQNPASSDIVLTVTVIGTTVTASCSHSSSALTQCIWYLDGVEQSGRTSSITINGVSSGKHTVTVWATDGFADYIKTASVTVN